MAGIAVGALALLASSSASAALSDAGGAAITNATLEAGAKTAAQDPNVTAETTAGGRDVLQRVNYAVGEAYGQALETATGEAVSLDRTRVFACQLNVRIEYYTPTSATTGYYTAMSGTTVSSPVTYSKQGVCVPTPVEKVVAFPGTSTYLDRVLQVHSWLTTNVSGFTTRHDYSPTFIMKRS